MELNEYVEILKNRKREVIAITLAVLFLVLLFSILQKPIYRATAVIEVQQSNVASNFLSQMNLPNLYNQPERQLSTQSSLITAEPLAAAVIKKLKLKMTPSELTKKISVSSGEKTDLIEVTISDNEPGKARLIANTLAQIFLENSKKVASSEVSKAKDEVSFKMKDIQEDVRLYSQLLGPQDDSAEPAEDSPEDVKTRIAIARDIYTDLAGQYQQLKILEDLSTGGLRLVVAASKPRFPSSPNLPNNMVLGLVLGLVAGGTWVFSTEYMDNTLKSADEMEKYLDLHVLGQIPVSVTDDGSSEQDGPHLVRPKSAVAEAYRSLRTNIQFVNFDNQARTIIVTSPTAGDGKTTVSANLAATLSLTGSKVALIDCDLRHPKIHKIIGLDNTVGVSSALVRSHEIDAVIKKVGNTDLSVITSGPVPPNPSELLGSGRMTELIRYLRERFDLIIIDTPPVCAVTDPVVLTSKADSVLLVCSINKTTREAATESRRALEKVKPKIMGVVVNRIDLSGRYGYYSRYGRNYHGGYYHYGADEANQKAG